MAIGDGWRMPARVPSFLEGILELRGIRRGLSDLGGNQLSAAERASNMEQTASAHILVSDPDRDGNSQHVVLCTPHLQDYLRQSPLGQGEYVVDVQDGTCDECAAH